MSFLYLTIMQRSAVLHTIKHLSVSMKEPSPVWVHYYLKEGLCLWHCESLSLVCWAALVLRVLYVGALLWSKSTAQASFKSWLVNVLCFTYIGSPHCHYICYKLNVNMHFNRMYKNILTSISLCLMVWSFIMVKTLTLARICWWGLSLSYTRTHTLPNFLVPIRFASFKVKERSKRKDALCVSLF